MQVLPYEDKIHRILILENPKYFILHKALWNHGHIPEYNDTKLQDHEFKSCK